jgi:hypothetical protein
MSNVGRPSKGLRDAITAKPPLPFGAILKENAKKLGYESYGDYLVAIAAQALDLPQYAPEPKRDRSEQLQFPQEQEGNRAAA